MHPIAGKLLGIMPSSEDKQKITGLAVSNNEVFIAHDQIRTVDVYDSDTLIKKPSLTIDELIDPWDLTAGGKCSCLYISHCCGGCRPPLIGLLV